MSDDVTRLRERAVADVRIPPGLAADSMRGYYRRRHRRRIARTALVASAAGIAGVLIWSAASGTDSAGVATVVPAKPAPTTVRNVSVSCDGRPITAQVLSRPGNAEKGNSPASQILRQFLRHNPFEGMGTVPSTNWLLLVDTPTEVAFGHREGVVGVGPVVHMQLWDGRVISQNLDGCSNVLVEKGRVATPIDAAKVQGRTVTLEWANGLTCGGRDPVARR